MTIILLGISLRIHQTNFPISLFFSQAALKSIAQSLAVSHLSIKSSNTKCFIANLTHKQPLLFDCNFNITDIKMPLIKNEIINSSYRFNPSICYSEISNNFELSYLSNINPRSFSRLEQSYLFIFYFVLFTRISTYCSIA